jgi:hypothetical protein
MKLINNQVTEVTEMLKRAIDAAIAYDALPVRYVRCPRNGWAGYKGCRRITKFHFSEAAAKLELGYTT